MKVYLSSMWRRTILLPMLLINLIGATQSWCPPGATWTFAYNDGLGGVIGHARVDHTSDTVLAGTFAQRLDVHVNAYSYPTQTYWNENPVGIWFTAGNDTVVQLWNPVELAFDTLYWFTALPGEHWSVPWTYGGVPDLLVLDTLHTTIDGLTLRQVVVGLDVPSPEPLDTLTERLGFREIFIDGISPLFLVDQPIGGLRCYSDSLIAWTDPSWSFGCASIQGMDDAPVLRDPLVFPDPGTDRFDLSLPPGAHHLQVIDGAGRIVIELQVEDGRPVDASTWPSGIYLLRLPELRRTARWIKE